MSKRAGLRRDLLVYGFGEVGVKAFSLLTLPIYTRIFTPDEFGALSILLTVAGFALAIIALGGDSAYVRYFMAARTDAERQTITSTWLTFLGVWSIGATLLVLPASPFLTDISTGSNGHDALMAIALGVIPFRLFNVMCAQALRNEFRAVAYTTLNIASVGVTVAGSLIGALVLNLGIAGILVGTFVAEVVILPVRIWTIRGLLGPVFSTKYLKRLLAYGLPLVPTSVAYWIFTTSDRILLGNLSTLEQAGLYSVAVSIVNLANIAIIALGQAWTPHAIKTYEADPVAASNLFSRMLIYVLFGFGLLAVSLTALAPVIVGVLAGGAFADATAGVAPLAIGMVAYATTQVTAGGITLRNQTAYFAVYSWAAAIVNIALNLVLIPALGMVGAALATAVAYISLTVAYGLTSHRLWRINYQWGRIAAMVALTVVAVVGGALLPSVGHLSGVGSAGFGLAYTALFAVILALAAGRQAIFEALPRAPWSR